MATAAEIFSTKGFAGTSMSDLAQTLGLSKAGIYHHFESKESIFQTLLQSTFEDLEDLVAEYKEIPTTQAERLAILQKFAEFMIPHRNVVRLALSEMQAEVKAQGEQSKVSMFRLQELLAGKKPSAETKLRVKISLGIIFMGIVPPPHEKLDEQEDLNLELLVKIASEALGASR